MLDLITILQTTLQNAINVAVETAVAPLREEIAKLRAEISVKSAGNTEIDYDKLLKNMDYGDVASGIDYDNLAREIDYSSLASEVNASDVAENLDLGDVAKELDLEDLVKDTLESTLSDIRLVLR